jgi:hypothetical protein
VVTGLCPVQADAQLGLAFDSRARLDLFFRKFHFQRQRPGDPVGQVRQSNQHMQVENLFIGKYFLSSVKSSSLATSGVRVSFRHSEARLARARQIPSNALPSEFHLLRCESGAFGALDVVLRAVMASVDQ